MDDTIRHYRGHKIIPVPCPVRGHGWRVESGGGRILVHHVGTLTLAKGIVDAQPQNLSSTDEV